MDVYMKRMILKAFAFSRCRNYWQYRPDRKHIPGEYLRSKVNIAFTQWEAPQFTSWISIGCLPGLVWRP